MNNAKRQYESTIIINATLEDDQIDTILNRIQEFITVNGGENVVVVKWGRKRLAYPIRKKYNGFYAVFEFVGPSTLIKSLEQLYYYDNNILRYLTIRLDKNAIKAKQLSIGKPIIESTVPIVDEIIDLEKIPLFDDNDEIESV